MQKPTLVVPARARRRRDWERILFDLRSAGCSFAEVARKCGRDASTVRMWTMGGDPKDSDARIVLALYRLCCPQQFEAHEREFGLSAPTPPERAELMTQRAEGPDSSP